MYIPRKQFFYWRVPAVTRVMLNTQPDRRAAYCFLPARLVTTVTGSEQSRVCLVNAYGEEKETSIKSLSIRNIEKA